MRVSASSLLSHVSYFFVYCIVSFSYIFSLFSTSDCLTDNSSQSYILLTIPTCLFPFLNFSSSIIHSLIVSLPFSILLSFPLFLYPVFLPSLRPHPTALMSIISCSSLPPVIRFCYTSLSLFSISHPISCQLCSPSCSYERFTFLLITAFPFSSAR